MQITGIRLGEYRSYESLTFAPAPGLNVLMGENAAGKTNVLESIFLLALGRSHRTRRDAELIRNGGDEARVRLSLEKHTGAQVLACRLTRAQGRVFYADGKPLTRSGELLGRLHVLMFSPEDLRLIKQGPSERRRFIDMELSQLYPAYYYALQRYNLALRQRNALLKNPAATADQHAPWEDQLAALGADITQKRAEFVDKLAVTARQLHAELSGGKEQLVTAYQPSGVPDKAAMLRALTAGRVRDALRGGTTSIGPHRDDILLTLDGIDVRAFGSQGQQRTAALSLKLSELLLLKSLRREPPILLLDDVLSELDAARQACLCAVMRGCQTFLTCTQLAGLEGAGLYAPDAAVFLVTHGAMTFERNGKD